MPEGTIVIRLFESAVRCITLFEGDQREAVECMEILCNALLEVNLHVFQEVWSQKIGFFFENAEKRPALMNLAHSLFNRDVSSPTITAIVLRYLVARLPQLGEYDDQKAAVTIRMFKMAFSAVSMHGAANEPILAHHLGKIIMDSFPLAAKATKPINYFHLLRLLFRAIGGGGGRFELLYKEVLPLLPEMLECLTRQLNSSEGMIRDMIVELCLTVPLRLTHLLPYLSYLMKPLVLALRGNPELVSQGLRTLELCIDNLTPDFLDPTLNIVLRDLMEALHSHLKPLPANHHHSHTTIRILGKLGGRNRRLLDKEPVLKYHEYAEPATSRISFGGAVQAIELRPLVPLASSTLVSGKGGATYRVHSYDYLESCVTLLLHEVSLSFYGVSAASNQRFLFDRASEDATEKRFLCSACKAFFTQSTYRSCKKGRRRPCARSHYTYCRQRPAGPCRKICSPTDSTVPFCFATLRPSLTAWHVKT